MTHSGRWLWVSRPANLEKGGFRRGDAGAWSCARATRAGQLALMYLAGAKEFLWIAETLSDARPDSDYGYMCDFKVVHVLARPLPLQDLSNHPAFRRWAAYRVHFQGTAFEIPDNVWSVFEAVGLLGLGNAGLKRVFAQERFDEGFRREIVTNRPERSPELVEEAKRLYGARCTVCGFDFGTVYGAHGEGFVEIHHLKPVAKMTRRGGTRIQDVVPVCANCHRMLHRGAELLKPEELGRLIARARRGHRADAGWLRQFIQAQEVRRIAKRPVRDEERHG